MKQVGGLHFLHHVHTEAIVSQANINASSYHLFNRRATDGVVHVRARVMHAIGMGFSQPTHLTAVYTHTVCSDAARPQNMICLQAIRYTHSIACYAIVLVRDILCHVYMEAYTCIGSTRGTAFKCRGTERKGGMQAITGSDHSRLCLLATFAPQCTYEAFVLADTRFTNSRDVPV